MTGLPQYSERDHKQDFDHENGKYINECCLCENMFYGHKRRVVCALCSESNDIKESNVDRGILIIGAGQEENHSLLVAEQMAEVAKSKGYQIVALKPQPEMDTMPVVESNWKNKVIERLRKETEYLPKLKTSKHRQARIERAAARYRKRRKKRKSR